MNTKGKVKVIKKGEQTVGNSTAKVNLGSEKTAQATARKMVSNVTNWVSEFQQKRREETTQALKMLVSAQPHTSGV